LLVDARDIRREHVWRIHSNTLRKELSSVKNAHSKGGNECTKEPQKHFRVLLSCQWLTYKLPRWLTVTNRAPRDEKTSTGSAYPQYSLLCFDNIWNYWLPKMLMPFPPKTNFWTYSWKEVRCHMPLQLKAQDIARLLHEHTIKNEHVVFQSKRYKTCRIINHSLLFSSRNTP
jgi:hypothetical protein